jgi:hypothetical protein
MKLLLFRGSPRSNIDEVESYNRENEKECDILYVRYAFEYDAYKWAREYFLKHKEYDYLLIATDDIVVKPEHIRQIKEDLKEFKFAVISGMMNVDQQEYNDQWGNLNICYELAMQNRKLRYYSWIKRNELPKDDIFQVKFAGFGLTAIRRDIVELLPFNTDSVFKGTGVASGASLDLVFCWYCYENKVPIYVDQRIDMKHLRVSGQSQAGERNKEVWLNDKFIQHGLNPL